MAADIDNRGPEHQTESEEYLRARVKALETKVQSLEKELFIAKQNTSAVEFEMEEFFAGRIPANLLIR